MNAIITYVPSFSIICELHPDPYFMQCNPSAKFINNFSMKIKKF